VSIEELSYDEAIKRGALALATNTRPGAGRNRRHRARAHYVHRSGEIGLFKLNFEGGVAAGCAGSKPSPVRALWI
jgi:hypothetical protein